jgi:hypothetical protein
MSNSWVMTICFGKTEISDPTVTGSVSHQMNQPSTTDLMIPDELLTAARPDYRALVQIHASRGAERHTMFTGFVDRVIPEGGSTRITLVSPSQFMREVSIGGLDYKNVDRREIMWSMARSVGFTPESISIQGWEPGPDETFEVATAINGISVDGPVALGRVTLLPDGLVSRLADDVRQEELRSRYAEGPVWALVLREARTLLEAQAEGVRQIDLALAWLTSRAHYSSVTLPGRTPRPFRRNWTLSRVHQRNVVVVRGLSTTRKWIRALQDIPLRPELAFA